MSPSQQPGEELEILRQKLAAVEAELEKRKHHETASEARFRQLLDAAPVMMWLAAADARCVYFNHAWLEFRGRAMDAEMGNGWTEGLHPDDRDFCIESYLKAFTLRQPYRVQCRMRRANGDYRWVEHSGLPWFEESDVFAGFMGSAVDIHDRKRGAFTPDEDAMRLVFKLTERERQVLVLVADGKSTREIGETLGISYKTADSHRSRILEKLGVHETASMVRYAIRAGLVTP